MDFLLISHSSEFRCICYVITVHLFPQTIFPSMSIVDELYIVKELNDSELTSQDYGKQLMRFSSAKYSQTRPGETLT